MADIAWTAYALAMFSDEQRQAAIEGRSFVPDEPRRPLPPPPAPPPTGYVGGFIVDGLNANDPAQAAELYSRGWRFENGRWTKLQVGDLGRVVDPDGLGRVGLSAVQSAAVIGGGSVLGYSVPVAPPVLLPSFIGGRLGRVEIAGGMRPESGGTERVIIGGVNAAARMPEVRF